MSPRRGNASYFPLRHFSRGRIKTKRTTIRPETPLQYDDNLTTERPTFVTHLECSETGEHYAADQIHNLSRAGKPLLVRYDLAGVKKALTQGCARAP